MRRKFSEFMWDAASRIVGIVAAGIVFLLGSIVARELPCWLGVVAPSVVVEGAEKVRRDKEGACFRLHLRKETRGKPLKPVFHLETMNGAYSPPLGVSVHRADETGKRINDPLPEHPLNTRWTTDYCFDMPGTVAPEDDILLSGRLLHRRWMSRVLPDGVLVEEPIPSFTIRH